MPVRLAAAAVCLRRKKTSREGIELGREEAAPLASAAVSALASCVKQPRWPPTEWDAGSGTRANLLSGLTCWDCGSSGEGLRPWQGQQRRGVQRLTWCPCPA